MSEKISPRGTEFEQIYRVKTDHETAGKIVEDATTLAGVAIRFAAVKRVPRYTPETRENDAEHSFMLALVAQDIAATYFPGLNTGLVAQFCIVHDLVELKTKDVATFGLNDADYKAKQDAEAAALDELCEELTPHTAWLVRVYEEQKIPEARLPRFVDKLLPLLVNIHGTGSQVMHEDYATFSKEQLIETESVMARRFESMFPEPELAPLHLARNALAQKFSEVFKPLPQLQDTLF